MTASTYPETMPYLYAFSGETASNLNTNIALFREQLINEQLADPHRVTSPTGSAGPTGNQSTADSAQPADGSWVTSRMAQLSHQLNTSHPHHPFRQAFVSNAPADLIEQLNRYLNAPAPEYASSPEQLWLVFSPQLQLPPQTSAAWARCFPAFEHAYDECLALLDGQPERPHQQGFVFQYCCYRLLEGLGVASRKLMGVAEGKLVVDVLTGKRSLAQALAQLEQPLPAEPASLPEKLSAFLARNARQSLGVVEVGPWGSISHTLRELGGSSDGLHLFALGSSASLSVPQLLGQLYCHGVQADWPSLRLQYKDFTAWQYKQLSKGELSRERDYWQEQFAQGVPVLELPTDFARPARKTFRGAALEWSLPKPLTAALKELGHQRQASLFMIMTAAVKVLLYRYSGQKQLVVGTPLAGRGQQELENQVGLYLNTIALRSQLAEDESFEQLLRAVKQTVLGAYQHHRYPFELLVEDLKVERDLSRMPLFDVMVVQQQGAPAAQGTPHRQGAPDGPHPAEQAPAGLAAESIVAESLQGRVTTSKFDLTVNFMEAQQIHLLIEYSTDLFTAARMERFARHLEGLLEAVAQNPQLLLGQIDYLSRQEKHQLLGEFNATQAHYPADATIVSLFEQQVERSPHAVALVFEDCQLTYRQVNQKANQLAHHLREHCRVEPGEVVGLLVERSERMVIGMLAILKVGAAYLPLEPALPLARLQYLVEDASARVVLTEQKLAAERALPVVLPVLFGDPLIGRQETGNPGLVNAPDELAYLMYTSGSTGKPKGVEVTHRSVCNFLASMTKRPGIRAGDKVLAITTYSFDISVLELFLPLVNGAMVLLTSKENAMHVRTLSNIISREQPALMQATPTLWRLLIDNGWSGHRRLSILSGGEPLSQDLSERLLERSACLWNLYGPTEATVWATAKCITRQAPAVSAGTPISNTQIYILDSHKKLLPVGVPGEVYIGGVCLARGYHNRAELTKEKFIPNPYRPGERLYATGDLGKWDEKGNLLLLGRQDDQVKIRGVRIELGEIESVLLSHNQVMAAAVIVQQAPQRQSQLVAYYWSSEPLTRSLLRQYLQERLPGYMVPGYFVEVDQLPLMPSGKLDRKALLALPLEQPAGADYRPPVNPTDNGSHPHPGRVAGAVPTGVEESLFQIGGTRSKPFRGSRASTGNWNWQWTSSTCSPTRPSAS